MKYNYRSKILILYTVILSFLAASTLFAYRNSVNIVIKQDPNMQKWLSGVINAYEKKYPERKVNTEIIGGSEGDYFTKIALMMKSNAPIDILTEDSVMLKGDIDAGHLYPIPDIKDWSGWNYIFPSLKDAVTFDDKVYGVPLDTDTRGLFYNVNIFKKAGIKLPWNPKNWNDIYRTLETIKKRVPDVFPISFNAGANGEGTSMQTAEMFLYGTGDTLYKNNKWVVTSKGLLSTLRFIHKLFKNNLCIRIDICLSVQYFNIMSQTLASEQKIAVILDGNWLTQMWIKKYPEIYRSYKFTAMPTEFGQKPGHISMSGGWVLAVSNKSGKKKEALEFIKFAMNKKNMLNYSQIMRNLTTRKDVAEMKDYPDALKKATEFLNFTHFRPANENYPIVSSYLQDAVEAVASNRQTPVDAMDQFANSVERSLGKDKVVKEYK